MTTSPVMSISEELVAELEALAVDVKGWNMPVAFQEPEEGFLPEDWEWHVGQIDEDDNRYPVLQVNAHQYDSSDSEKLARYYAACNRDTILALLAERAEMKQRNERMRAALNDARYRIEQGRIWNGMGWTLTGLSPHGQQKALDALAAADAEAQS